MSTRSIICIWVVLLTLSCGKQTVTTEAELKAYVIDPENGLVKAKRKNDIEIEVIFRPSELVAVLQLVGINDPDERRRTIEGYDSLSYFVLRLSNNGQEIENSYVSSSQKFVRIINYLSTSISQNIYMIHAGDTIPALDVVYARMFGSATATSVMTVFDVDVKSLSDNIIIVLDDTELQLGKNHFSFDINNIKKTPTLKLK